MKTGWLRLALAVSCLASGPGPALAAKITDPDWRSKPTAEHIAQYYPELAMLLSLSGRAILSCQVETTGRLRACAVPTESPQGLGFGAAALKLAPHFEMTPRLVNGKPAAGGDVQIPIRFVLPPLAPTPGTPKAVELPPEKRALLARLAPQRATALERSMLDRIERVIAQSGDTIDETVKADARSAAAAAGRDIAPAWAEAGVSIYADLLDESALEAQLAFSASPAGQALDAASDEMGVGLQEAYKRWNRRVAEAAKVLCELRDCTVETWKPPAGATLVDPPMASAPTLAELAEHGPPLINALQLDGWAQLTCDFDTGGAVFNCVVTRESPERLGLGSAAMALAPKYRIKRETAAAAHGSTVAIPVRFNHFPIPEAGIFPRDKASPTPETLELAGRLVAKDDIAVAISRATATLVAGLGTALGGGKPTEDQFQALAKVLVAAHHAALQDVARLYATHLTREQLEAVIAHRDRSTSQAYRLKASEIEARLRQVNTAYGQMMTDEVRRRFCELRACSALETATPDDISRTR